MSTENNYHSNLKYHDSYLKGVILYSHGSAEKCCDRLTLSRACLALIGRLSPTETMEAVEVDHA